MSIKDDFETFIAEFEEYLQGMGVVDASFDRSTGLMGLADTILNIPPYMNGIPLSTSLTCNAPSKVSVDVPFTVTGVLSATYDDEDITLTGAKLSGATIKIYDENNLLGTTLTNNNGMYSFSYTPNNIGILNIRAVYDSSNDGYKNVASSSTSMNVTVPVSSLTLFTNTDYLSYSTNDVANLTAIVLNEDNEAVANQSVNFNIINNTTGEVIKNIGSSLSDSNGIATINYNSSSNDGDICVKANVDEIMSNDIIIKNVYLFDSLTKDNGNFEVAGTPTYSDDGAVLGHYSGCLFLNNLSSPCQIEFDYLSGGSEILYIMGTQNIRFERNGSTSVRWWAGCGTNATCGGGWGSGGYETSVSTNYGRYRFNINNNHIEVYLDDMYVTTINASDFSTFGIRLSAGYSSALFKNFIIL